MFLAWVEWRFHWTCECRFQAHQQARLSFRGEEQGGSSEREEGAGGFSLICSSSGNYPLSIGSCSNLIADFSNSDPNRGSYQLLGIRKSTGGRPCGRI